LCDYIKEKYDEPPPSKLEDESHKDNYPSTSSHEPFLHDILDLEENKGNEVIEDLVAPPLKEHIDEECPHDAIEDQAQEESHQALEEHNDEDSSHISIEDQAQKEDSQVHEEAPYPPMEDLEDESTHASSSPPHDVEVLESLAPSQISEFDNLPCYDLERDNLEDKPSNDDEVVKECISPFDEDNGTLGHGFIDITFHIFYHDRKPYCWIRYGGPIYDAYNDVSIE
jgi:hypothetical protein